MTKWHINSSFLANFCKKTNIDCVFLPVVSDVGVSWTANKLFIVFLSSWFGVTEDFAHSFETGERGEVCEFKGTVFDA